MVEQIEWHETASAHFAKATKGAHKITPNYSTVKLGTYEVTFNGKGYPLTEEPEEVAAFAPIISLNNAELHQRNGKNLKRILTVDHSGAINMDVHHFENAAAFRKALDFAEKIAAAVKKTRK